jgi:hypothetical protein
MYEYTGILLGARPILHISRLKVNNTVWNLKTGTTGYVKAIKIIIK